MADLHSEVRNLADLVEEVTKACVLLKGTETHPGLIQQIQKATAAGEDVAGRLEVVQALSAKLDGLSEQFQLLPERLFSKVDSLAFRSAVSQIMTEETGSAIEKIQDITLDHLESGVTRLGDRLADDLFTRKIDPSLRSLEGVARLKQDREDYRVRAEKAEKALADHQALSEKAEQSVIDQIERIRVSATQPNRWALFAMFALGWACAVFAADAWSVITHWIVQQPIPAWFLPRI